MEEFNTIVDFLKNDRFRLWLQTRDADTTLYWAKWLEENPSKRHLFETAVASFRALEGGKLPVSEASIASRVNELKDSLTDGEPVREIAWLGRPFMGWAAALIAVVIAGSLFWLRESTLRIINPLSQVVQPLPGDVPVVVRNTNAGPMLLNLPDNSSVLLEKNSTLEYINDPTKFNREVKLTGEGFFEVVKDADHPFYVRTSLFTTKVLGTSFLIRSFDDEAKATVRVRTGRVEVTSTPLETKTRYVQAAHEKPEPMLLMPNEEASLLRKTAELVREKRPTEKLGSNPELFNVQNFAFRFTPVTEVFDLLEKTYGARIIYDKAKFKNCTLTADLTDEPFLEKLRLICVSTEAQFEVSEKGIRVSGAGCL